MLRVFVARPDQKSTAGMDPEELVQKRAAGAVPLGRTGQPEEIANAALFLISHEAAFLTGGALPLGGGATAAGTERNERCAARSPLRGSARPRTTSTASLRTPSSRWRSRPSCVLAPTLASSHARSMVLPPTATTATIPRASRPPLVSPPSASPTC